MKLQPAHVVILAGVTAAMHVGKLPTALPVLRAALGLDLLESGFLLSLVQFAGMALGLAVGLLADGFGLRRTMVSGLAILALASALGAGAHSAAVMLVLRGLEGLGLLLTVLPAPSLIRSLVPVRQLSRSLGLWGIYMPTGTALALALGPWAVGALGWRAWWLALAALAAALAFGVWLVVPDDRRAGKAAPTISNWPQRLHQTLSNGGPWLAAGCFAVYSGQWLAVVGFLPTIYADAGIAAGRAGLLTALVAGCNMLGNMASGQMLHRGLRAQTLMFTGFATMGVSSVLVYAGLGAWLGGPLAQLLCACIFSAVGGLIPGTLFAVAVRVAPSLTTVSTTVGWMQQWSSLGQLGGPPLVAWLAAQRGDWHSTWWFTVTCSLLGLGMAWVLCRRVAPG